MLVQPSIFKLLPCINLRVTASSSNHNSSEALAAYGQSIVTELDCAVTPSTVSQINLRGLAREEERGYDVNRSWLCSIL